MEPTQVLNGHNSSVYSVISESDHSFLTSGGDGLVVRWSLDSSEGEAVVKVSEAVFSMFLIRHRGLLLLGTEGGSIHVIDLESKQEIKLFRVHQKGVFEFTELKSGFVVSAGGDGSIGIWDPSTLTLIRQIPIAEGKIRDLAISDAGINLAIAMNDNTVRILDTELFNERHTIQAHPKGANCVAWHPSKPVLMSGGRDGMLRIWHTEEDYREVLSLPAHEQTIYRIRFSGGGLFATASRDKSAKLWHAASLDFEEKLEHAGKGHTHSVNDCLWLNERLVTVNDDGLVRVFRTGLS